MHDITISKSITRDQYIALNSDILALLPPDSISGLSWSSDGTIIIHLLNPDEENNATFLVNVAATLTLSATKTTINADGIDETIITGAGLSCECIVWYEQAIVNQTTIADGTAEVSIGEAGSYLVELRQADGTSGFIEIEAV